MYYRSILLIVIILLSSFSCKNTSTNSTTDPVTITIPDANFAQLIRETINKPDGELLDTDL